jgi:hypothetical protein
MLEDTAFGLVKVGRSGKEEGQKFIAPSSNPDKHDVEVGLFCRDLMHQARSTFERHVISAHIILRSKHGQSEHDS